jgi:PhzF family phenazine biosynthesis protein
MTNVTLRLVQVDAFTSRPLSGNAAAIVFGAEGLDQATMQAIARETNLSETVFVLAPHEGGDYRARIFTTRREIAFAVHPTIAAAHAVAEQRGLASGGLVQECGVGLVRVERDQDFPGWAARVPESRFAPIELDRVEAADCLGLGHDDISARPIERVATGPDWIMIELSNLDALGRLDRDHRAIARVSRRCEAVGFAVFVRDPVPGVDARMRAFAPAEGIFEDPVCGSCAGSLAALLYRDDPLAERAVSFLFEQGSEIGRLGRLYARMRPDGLIVGGEAVSVLRGTLDIRG